MIQINACGNTNQSGDERLLRGQIEAPQQLRLSGQGRINNPTFAGARGTCRTAPIGRPTRTDGHAVAGDPKRPFVPHITERLGPREDWRDAPKADIGR